MTKNEVSSFWLLKVVVENIVPLYHTKTMDNLITDIDVLSELIRLRAPDVHRHIFDLGKCACNVPVEFNQNSNRFRSLPFRITLASDSNQMVHLPVRRGSTDRDRTPDMGLSVSRGQQNIAPRGPNDRCALTAGSVGD